MTGKTNRRPAAGAGEPIDPSRLVDRDTCFRCGARGDYGCKCSKAPLGWSAGSRGY
jgi:hypothetical protein